MKLYADLASLLTQSKPNWKLTREGDGLVKHSVDVRWLEFNDKDECITYHDMPKIGYSLLMSPFNTLYTWQTTEVAEIVSQDGATVKFKTKNSIYKLEKI
jgi:hypothetical protein